MMVENQLFIQSDKKYYYFLYWPLMEGLKENIEIMFTLVCRSLELPLISLGKYEVGVAIYWNMCIYGNIIIYSKV